MIEYRCTLRVLVTVSTTGEYLRVTGTREVTLPFPPFEGLILTGLDNSSNTPDLWVEHGPTFNLGTGRFELEVKPGVNLTGGMTVKKRALGSGWTWEDA